jgi:hypothetical protein
MPIFEPSRFGTCKPSTLNPSSRLPAEEDKKTGKANSEQPKKNISKPAIKKEKKSKIMQTSSILPIKEELNKDQLVIIELDDVVFYPINQTFRSNNRKTFSKIIKKFKKEKNIDKEKWNGILKQQKLELIDTEWKKILQRFMSNDAPLLLLSINDQYNFAQALLEHKLSFNPPNVKSKKGIKIVKGITIIKFYQRFLEFLEKVIADEKSKEIIYISTNKKRIEAMQELCEKLNVDFTGCEYTFVKILPPLDEQTMQESILNLLNEKASKK